MRIVLLEDVAKLGRVGNVVEVKPGYARNYLIPFGKAKRATASNLRFIQERGAELDRLQSERLEAARVLAGRLQELSSVKIAQQAGLGGRLFGSVTTQRIMLELSSLGYLIPKGSIKMPEIQIRQIGQHAIQIVLHPDVSVNLVIDVVPVAAELPSE